MNPLDNKFAYVVNWQTKDGKQKQDEIIRVGFYDSINGRSWVHDYSNIDNGLEYFVSPLPKENLIIFKVSEKVLANLRACFIIIPEAELIFFAEEILTL